MTTMKRLTAGIVSLTMACTMMFAPVEAGSESFCSPAVITASADSSEKLTGKHQIVWSKVGITSNELSVYMNKQADIDYVVHWAEDLAFTTSGFRNASEITKFGKGLVDTFGGGSGLLSFFNFLFGSLAGTSDSAKYAYQEILRLHEEFPYNGLILRIRQDSRWSVELQGEPKPLREVSVEAEVFSEGNAYIFSSCGYYIGTAGNKTSNKTNVQAVTKANATVFIAHYNPSIGGWTFRAKNNKNLVLNFFADYPVVSKTNVNLYTEQSKADATQYIIPKKTDFGGYNLLCAANSNVALEMSGYANKVKSGTNIRAYTSIDNEPTQIWSIIRV